MDKIIETSEFLQSKGFLKPEVGIILGTGLGTLLDHIEVIKSIEYKKIPNFAEATVEFHQGKLIFGILEGKKVLAMAGRFHSYEGYSMKEIAFPVRVMKEIGVQNLIVSNAAGGINLNYNKSDLMIIEDHINLLSGNPLTGKNIESQGPRFPDMSEPYSFELIEKLEKIAKDNGVAVNKGVYAAVSGPNLETRAEYKYLKIIGADAVGMSTVPEVIVANHVGLPCCAISVITDLCNPDNLQAVDISEIIAAAVEGEKKLIILVKALVKKL